MENEIEVGTVTITKTTEYNYYPMYAGAMTTYEAAPGTYKVFIEKDRYGKYYPYAKIPVTRICDVFSGSCGTKINKDRIKAEHNIAPSYLYELATLFAGSQTRKNEIWKITNEQVTTKLHVFETMKYRNGEQLPCFLSYHNLVINGEILH